MGPEALAQVLRPLKDMFPIDRFPNLILGLEGGDDAAVYRISKDLAVILTLDFITPVVDNPVHYGMIAAANAMSDVYAMGGEVSLCLNICSMPPDLNPEIIMAILKGGAEKVLEAGGALVGGHTVDDHEPKYGMVVMGLVNPDKLLSNKGAQLGDVMVLTKPVGSGIITTAWKGDQACKEHLETATEWMLKLNRKSMKLMKECNVHACTDVTGFSILGHALDIAKSSGVSVRIDLDKIEFLPGAKDYANNWLFPGGTCNNQKAYEQHIQFDKNIPEEMRQLLFTPETSGGLLFAVPSNELANLILRFKEANETCYIIGEIQEGQGITVSQS